MAHDTDDGAPKRARLSDEERGEALAQLVVHRTKLTATEALLLREVFHDITALHERQVRDQLRRRGLPGAAVEDLVQEVFVALFAHILKEGFPDKLAALLHTITERKLTNHVRDLKRNPVSIGLPSSGSEPPRSPPALDQALDFREVSVRLLHMLSEEHREVVTLVIVNGLEYAEAAETLGIPVATMKSRLIVAKRRLLELAEQLLPPSQWPTT